jgi:hypothetical protein
MHKLDIKSSTLDSAGVDICEGTCSSWTSLGNFTSDTSGWASASLSIPSAFLNKSNVKIRFRLTTGSTTQLPTWYIDDVKILGPSSFTAWSTLLVRLEEKLLTVSDFLNGSFALGDRVNKILIYYSTPTPNGSGDHPGGTTDVNRLGSNPQGTLNWPAADGASDRNFTLVQWDWVRSSAYITGNTSAVGTLPVNTVVETKYYRTKDSATTGDSLGSYTVTSSYDEVSLTVFGETADNNVYFDDLGIKIGTVGNDGTGQVIQYP